MTETPPQGPVAPSPRAFCHATGLVFQVVGFVLAMGSCCWWSIGERITGGPELIQVKDGKPVNVLDPQPPAARYAVMLSVCISLLGGLGLTAVGIGLQHDLAQSSKPSLVVCAIPAAYFWTYFGTAIWQFPGAARIIVAGAMAIVWTAMFLLAGASGDVLKNNPPPKRDSGWTSRDEDDLRSGSSLRPPGGTNR